MTERYLIFFMATVHQLVPASWSKEQARLLCEELNSRSAVSDRFDRPYWVQKVVESDEVRLATSEIDYL